MENKNKKHVLVMQAQRELSHGVCVSNLSHRVAKELGLNEELCYEIAKAGMIHDVGRMELSRYIYAKEGKTLNIEQMKYARTHPTIGYTMLDKKQYSKTVLDAVLYHHENYDGTGYPSNLRGGEIPLAARILRVCDSFAAFIEDRPLRRSFDVDTAVELMIEEVKNYDMRIFLIFLNVIHKEDIDEFLDNSQLIFEDNEA